MASATSSWYCSSSASRNSVFQALLRSCTIRFFDNAKITLIGTDQTDPSLVLYGLPGHRALFEKLRDAVQFARASNRPMELAPGHHEGDLTGGVEHHHH